MQKRESLAGTVGGPKLQLRKTRWVFILTVLLVLALPSLPVLAKDSDDLQTVYHVYIDDESIGTVSDKEAAEEIVDEKINVHADDYPDLTLTTDKEVSYIEEKAFQPDVNDNKVQNQLEDELNVQAEAREIEVGGETVVYLKDKKAATNLLKEYKESFVDEDELDELEKPKHAGDAHKIDESDKDDLSPGDSVITKVSFSEDVNVSKAAVSPDEVIDKKEGLKLLEEGTLEDEVHEVEEGEVLGSIADDYDLSEEEILDINSDLSEDSTLQIDDEVHVTAYEPYMDVLVEKEKIKKEKISYDEKVEDTDDLYKGEEEKIQKGKKGKEEVHYTIQEKNGDRVDKKDTDHNVVKEPKEEIVQKGTKEASSRGTGDLSWPVDGGHISSEMGGRWGKQHKGIDIAGPNSETITAADNGVVTEAGNSGDGYGNKIAIDHNNGMKTMYAHLSSIDVEEGETVEEGHSIGVMGSTGNSTGTHLHFEVHEDGDLKNPKDYVQP